MLLSKLLEIIDKNLPAETALDGDRIGLQIQGGNEEISKILVTLEVTDDVIDEAGQLNCDCIITFHPLIFNSLKSLINSERVGNLCHRIIKQSITVIAVHTNFDVFSEGTSKILAEKLELQVIDFLVKDKKYSDRGMGIIAKPETSLQPKQLLDRVYKVCNSPIRFTYSNSNDLIEKIAIVGGSGTSFLQDVLNANVQAFITADITYHRFHEVYKNIMLIDPGHYEMEQFVPEGLAKLLTDKLDRNEIDGINVSKALTNPVRYYPDLEIYENRQKNYLINKKR